MAERKLFFITIALVVIASCWLAQSTQEDMAMIKCQKKLSFEVCFYLIKR